MDTSLAFLATVIGAEDSVIARIVVSLADSLLTRVVNGTGISIVAFEVDLAGAFT